MRGEVRVIVGIDEAGRGAQIGPLVLAAVAATSARLRALRCPGLRDPKGFSGERREALASAVRRHIIWSDVEVAPAAEVDMHVRAGRDGGAANLNTLEREMAKRLLARAPSTAGGVALLEQLEDRQRSDVPPVDPRQLSLDLPADVVADGRALFGPLVGQVPCLLAFDHADVTHPAVAAAALLAKIERDRLLDDIDRRYASIVGPIPRRGYPGPETTAWLARYTSIFHATPEERATWRRRSEEQHALAV